MRVKTGTHTSTIGPLPIERLIAVDAIELTRGKYELSGRGQGLIA